MVPSWVKVGKGLRVRETTSTGVTRIDIDPTAVRQLREAYESTLNTNCGWRFCPGPDAHHATPMATCAKCNAAILLRRALKRLGIETA